MRKWIIGMSALSVVSILYADPTTDSFGAAVASTPSSESVSSGAAQAAAAVSTDSTDATPVPMQNLSTTNANVPAQNAPITAAAPAPASAAPAPALAAPKHRIRKWKKMTPVNNTAVEPTTENTGNISTNTMPLQSMKVVHHYRFHCLHWVKLQKGMQPLPDQAPNTRNMHCTQWVPTGTVVQTFAPASPPKIAKHRAKKRHIPHNVHAATSVPASTSTTSSVTTSPSKLVVNGFISAGAAVTNSPAEYNIPARGSVNHDANFMLNSLVGLQLTANMTDQLSAIAQVIATGDNTNGNTAYQPQLDWAFLRYAVNNNFQVRGGHMRVPALLYSETQEVGYSYPWVTLPNEVYSVVPFSDMNGAQVIYSHPISDSSWSFQVQPFAGQSQDQFDVITGNALTFNENNFLGTTVSVSNPSTTLRGSYAHTQLNIANNATIGAVNHKNMDFYAVGLQTNLDNVLFSSEFAHRDTPNNLASLTGYYAMLGYQYHAWLPNFTYGHLNTTNKNSMPVALQSTLPEAQQSYTLGLDYYFNNYIVGKVSASLIQPQNGTNGLFSNVNGNPAKNVMLYGMSFDAIF